MYVISPTDPSPGSEIPSYSRCASVIVLRAEKPSFRAASCCNVEVVNGGAGDRFRSFRWTSRTRYAARRSRSTCGIASVSAPSRIPFLSGAVASLPSGISVSRATKGCCSSSPGPSGVNRTSMLQYSTGTKARISRSRSTISRTATDCTRPADRPGRTFLHRIGLIRYPTRRSRIRRASWASTSFRSIARGCRTDSRIASRVISVNVMRLASSGETPSRVATWYAIASPSRS